MRGSLRRIRVLIVDDSTVTREYLAVLLARDPAIEVVGQARDGVEGVAGAERLRPDLVLMDAHMPRLSGCEAARQIMERFPTPIVIASASLSKGEVTLGFEALEAGALTLVDKPIGPGLPGSEDGARRLVETVKLMADVKVVRRHARRSARASAAAAGPVPADRPLPRLIAVGASTGGPVALARLLRDLAPDLAAPVLVVQHIAPGFAGGLADWLERETSLTVKLAEHEEPLRARNVYVAPHGQHLGVTAAGRVTLEPGREDDGFCPSASRLFASVAASCGSAAIGVLLTGMGRDGAEGLLELRRAGAATIAQDSGSSVVFGMPAAAIELGAAQHVLALEEIAALIRRLATPDGT